MDNIIHEVSENDWYASQITVDHAEQLAALFDSLTGWSLWGNKARRPRGVQIWRRPTRPGETATFLRYLEPPVEWGDNWSWNIHPDGNAIVFYHHTGDK